MALRVYMSVCVATLIYTELSDLRDSLQVERYQDQAQAMLREHVLSVAATRPARPRASALDGLCTDDSHNRFGRLLLVLPLIRSVKPRALELFFFRAPATTSPLAGAAVTPLPVERLLCEMFKNW